MKKAVVALMLGAMLSLFSLTVILPLGTDSVNGMGNPSILSDWPRPDDEG